MHSVSKFDIKFGFIVHTYYMIELRRKYRMIKLTQDNCDCIHTFWAQIFYFTEVPMWAVMNKISTMSIFSPSLLNLISTVYLFYFHFFFSQFSTLLICMTQTVSFMPRVFLIFTAFILTTAKNWDPKEMRLNPQNCVTNTKYIRLITNALIFTVALNSQTTFFLHYCGFSSCTKVGCSYAITLYSFWLFRSLFSFHFI